MAKKIIYSVLDKKVELYAQPFFMRTRGEAMRGWEAVSNDPANEISKYPHDFVLMELGYFDEETGTFENTKHGPLELGAAVHMQRQKNENKTSVHQLNISSASGAGDLSQGGA